MYVVLIYMPADNIFCFDPEAQVEIHQVCGQKQLTQDEALDQVIQ